MSHAREPETTPTAKPSAAGRGRLEPDLDPATAVASGQPRSAPPGVVRSVALAVQRAAGNRAATALVEGVGPTVQRTVGIVDPPGYEQSGVLRGEKTGDYKNAEFDFTAKFDPVPAGTAQHPLEVRQEIRWDKEYEDTAGGPPPHFGDAAADVWHEDRSPDTPANDVDPAVPGTRYGHRAGKYANPFQERDDLDKYVEAGDRTFSDRLIGEEYVGSDSPKVGLASQGRFDFRLTAVDTTAGDRVLATSETLTVDWNDAADEPSSAQEGETDRAGQ
ncbi:hypothetical protein FHX81_6361 [Saccharothrix saharensis]|uniref:Uncharacterized protein n=1 Tax=Saccharothrix saharensis TaxID=571190 RepID=A0A543JM49_9PSEU|nr:hypothetical protein [Saccharothrix saharensis]TQM83927.1 hypothetical protein FHX81_6361 [Saccharothrix saharensis]